MIIVQQGSTTSGALNQPASDYLLQPLQAGGFVGTIMPGESPLAPLILASSLSNRSDALLSTVPIRSFDIKGAKPSLVCPKGTVQGDGEAGSNQPGGSVKKNAKYSPRTEQPSFSPLRHTLLDRPWTPLLRFW